MRNAFKALAVVGLVTAAVPAADGAPSARYVDLQLLLAVDVSRSMDANEQKVQRDGYVAAFRNADLHRAIASVPYGRIAVTYVEWSSASYQKVLIPWRIISSDEDALVFADDLARAPIGSDSSTSIAGALSFAWDLFQGSGLESDRMTIDVSGDGPNNHGDSLPAVRARLLAQGVNINGLPLLFDPAPVLGEASLADYYEDCVIGGVGAFMIPVRTLGDFASAIRRKLMLEIAAVSSPVVPVLDLVPDRRKVDCIRAEATRVGPP